MLAMPARRANFNLWLYVKGRIPKMVIVALFAVICYYYYDMWQRWHRSPAWLFWRERTGDEPYPRILLWDRSIRPLPLLDPDSAMPLPLLDPDSPIAEKYRSSKLVHCEGGYSGSFPCEVTDRRSQRMRSDAIVFETDRVAALGVPPSGARFQLWALWTQTHLAPANLDAISRKELTNDTSFHVIGPPIEWTAGRSGDADIVVMLPSPRIQVPYWRCALPGDEPPAAQSQKHEPRERLGIGWIVGEREEHGYADVLALRPNSATGFHGNLAVHLVRRCGLGLCGDRATCIGYVARHFKFIVVTLTPDCFHSAYEVIYNTFKYDLVPIVLAPPGTTLNVPGHSVVSTEFWQGPGQLAAHVNHLLKNPDSYNTYFLWKRTCTLVPNEDSFCSLCRALWETPSLPEGMY
ncbi:alpha-(1,3)-fucosyltransferase 4-like [Amblyomma americanum]